MQTVSGYEYSQSSLLGHGAFALVFRGRKKKSHEPVAIKQIALKAVPGKLSSIRQKEITILKELTHPNIVKLHDYVETSADIFLIMEYCNGGDMGDYLQSKGTLSETSIRHLARHIGSALKALYRLQIIHRDIKPQNLLLSYPPSRREHRQFRDATIKLADFGFARYLTGTDLAATLCGSPLYMAPEILLGERYDSKADLWSVGTILFQCLSGTAPFLASNPHALRKKYEKEKLVPKIPEDTSQFLADLLLKLLKKEPQKRIAHDAFFSHPFLRDPSSSASSPAGAPPSLPLEQLSHAKSSPVPIRRHTHTPSPFSNSPSPRLSASPHRGSLESSGDVYYSPSSGPPSIHRVGSSSSFQYRSHSPNSDVTDQGFIIVDLPGSAGSRRYSLSPSQSPGSYSSASHTPSSGGSLTRYATLTTPFYQVAIGVSVPPPAGAARRDQTGTPTGTPIGTFSGSRSPNPSPPLSRSNSTKRRTSDPFILSHTPPFSKLLSQTQHQRGHSGSATLHSNSPHTPNFSGIKASNSPSPLSTPPSSLLSQSPGTAKPLHSYGMRYALSAHGSGTKLSSLAEHVESKPQKRAPRRSDSGPKLSACDEFITHSQLLHSDEEDDFPMSMSLTSNSSSQASSKTDEQDSPEPDIPEPDMARHLGFTQSDAHFASSQKAGTSDVRPRRAASFTDGTRSSALSHKFQEIRRRATDLSALRDTFGDADFTPTPTERKTFDLSPTSALVPFKLPFLISGSHEGSRRTGKIPPSSLRRSPGQKPEGRAPPELKSSASDDASCQAGLTQSMELARELLAMAAARQGPILLLSTDLSDSGVAGRMHRCCEQLVLCAKAVTVLESGLRQYEIELAARNVEPSEGNAAAEGEARTLLETCLEKAKSFRETLQSYGKGRRMAQVSAERLLFLEALDSCKAAVLDECSSDTKECIKRYRRAKLIFQQLFSDASTQKDKAVLQNYIHSAQKRIQCVSQR